ncbi:translation factor Sua5 [Bifidobacterium dolichotidis]|uniref:L-threonylcarbamoyladenylate synthase n=1 Tax=Bifidobacterium dolichotidis TaxID=2306976 RepID=A0A430FSS7_9BIFI|nr:L-threonylcarbamoyladenylate synthase [Bifidobacterium dolichotidis]RSX55928.1 translation factor Sua5 [Bifidobacterium dolichotidis]
MSINVQPINDQSIKQAKQIIRNGGLVVIPTDTVYCIACDPFNEQAVHGIYEAKHRPAAKSLQIVVDDVRALADLGLELPSPLEHLAAHFMPGAFSPIAEAKSDSCALCTLRHTPSGKRTQGIRVPNFAKCLQLLREVGPMACSSANQSGEESAQSVDQAIEAFGESVDLYLDGGPTAGHVASTVVEADPAAKNGIRVLREGCIPTDEVNKAL